MGYFVNQSIDKKEKGGEKRMDDDILIIGKDFEGLLAVEVTTVTDDNIAYLISSDMKRDLEEVFKKHNLPIELN